MVRVKVTRNYRVTIPARIREDVGFRVGGEVEVNEHGNIVIRKLRRTFRLGRRLTPDGVEELIERGLKKSLLSAFNRYPSKTQYSSDEQR